MFCGGGCWTSCCGGVAAWGGGWVAGALPFIGRSAEPDVPWVPAPPPGLIGPVRLVRGDCCGCGEGASGTGDGCCGVSCASPNGLKLKPRSAANAVDLKPAYEDAYYNLGFACYKNGDLTKAIFNYNKAVEINPNDTQAQNNRAAILNTLKDKNK